MDDSLFRGQGFVYWATRASPDGSILVLNGYSGGEKSPTLIEPRVVSAATGRILLDLWHSYQNYELDFGDAGLAVLTVENTRHNRKRLVDVNFTRETFAFRDVPDVAHPLSALRELVSLH